MSYAHPRASGRRLTGLVVTVAFHILLVYAVMTGLARKIVEVVRPPLETKIIEEVKTPPPDKPPPPPPPKLVAPPPPFIPPPEVVVQVPVQPAPAITAVVPTPPPAPIPPPAAPAPTPAPQPVHVPVRTPPVVQAASCEKPPYPSAARRANETGTVLLTFLIDTNGSVVESKVERSSGSRRLDEAARQGLELCKFKPGMVDGRPTRSWARLEYVWKLE
jgi:periplasmic protein TonB